MKMRKVLFGMLIQAAVLATPAAASAIDFTTGIATGVRHESTGIGTLQDGSPITYPLQDYLANKEYTAQLVPTGSAEKSEAFVAIGGQKDLGFGSAVSDGRGALEVGVFNTLRRISTWAAVSRYYTTIKNNTDNQLDFTFYYMVEPGELVVQGIRSDFTAHARVEAAIDYLLLTPDGGAYEESTGRLFHYFADIDFDNRASSSSNAGLILLERDESVLAYATSPLSGSVKLPTIPGRGELTFYYDMFASFTSARPEVGGWARLGDPTDLVGGSAPGLVQTNAVSQTPEPGTLLLIGAGLLSLRGIKRGRH